MEEIYKQIKGTSYFVSNHGNIKTYNWKNKGKEAILKPALSRKGYLKVGLQINGKLKSFFIHRLVGIAFVPNPENKPQINHKDTNKTNNKHSNLEWCTNQENMIHAIKNGLCKSRKGIKRERTDWLTGSNNSNSLLTESKVLEIRSKFKKRIYTREMLGAEYGVSPATIKDIILRRSWKHV